MLPSDYRHNPFSDVSTAVQKSEIHRIPRVSPYTIQLNEVPVKSDPSTMRIQWVGISTGGVSVGGDLVEVAASPAAGQFYPDYNTFAAGDKNWNTGEILFNSQNAGNVVKVTYLAQGTLASVKSNKYPNEWVDTGDGSDGDFWPTSNVTISGVKNYRSVIIPANVTVTVAPWAKIKCQEVCWINGVLSAYGTGAPGGARAGDGTAENKPGKAGAYGVCGGNGGAGGKPTALINSFRGAAGLSYFDYPAIYNSSDTAALLLYDGSKIGVGAGGGSGGSIGVEGTSSGGGGNGGGYIRIIAKSIHVLGSINASGANGESGRTGVGGGGGGGGGVIILIGQEINYSSSVIAYGGIGGNSGGGASAGDNGNPGIFIAKELGWS